MKTFKLLLFIILSLAFAVTVNAEGNNKKTNKLKYADKVKKMEETFWAASKEGKTVKGVFIEGNSFFNGTNQPQEKPLGEPYTEEELYAAKQSAERNSKIMFLSADGSLYFPCPKKGTRVSMSDQAHRMPRILTEEQKQEKDKPWATSPPLLGRVVEIYGIIYPGYAGVKGIHIESIYFEGQYIVGKN